MDKHQSAQRGPSLVALTMVLTILLVPYSSANSGLGWAGVVESEYSMGTAVSYSPNGDILASSHADSVLISNALTQEKMQDFIVDFQVESLEFTSDASRLIVGMESELPNTPSAVVFELTSNGDYTRAKHTEDGKNIDSISISPDDLFFATSTEDGGMAEWHIDIGTGTNLDMASSYPPSHVGKINCIDHSKDGTHLLSGGEGGSVILWDRNNQTEVAVWETSEPIEDCGFSPDGSLMAWIGGGSLYLRNYDQTFSYEGQLDISKQASQVEFFRDRDTLAILVDEIVDTGMGVTMPRKLDFINASSLPIQVERSLWIPHKAIAFSLHPTLNNVAISTQSEFVPIYSNEVFVESEIPSAIDTDQDNIPDFIDEDDDGDGTPDLYDNICSSGNNCHLKPDPAYMRNIRIEIDGNEVAIHDTIHLDSRQSAAVRRLVADSVSEPVRVDQGEYDNYLASVCTEYDQNEVKSRWVQHIEFENSTFIANQIACQIDSGLYATRTTDTGTRISITWSIFGVSTLALNAPYNMTLFSGVKLPSSSVAQVVHAFPMRVEIHDASGLTHVEEIWNRRSSDLDINVIQPPEIQPTEIETLINHIVEYWYAIFFAIVCVGSGVFTVIVRRSNRIDFSELEENQRYDEEWEDIVDDAAAWDEITDFSANTKRKPKPPEAVRSDLEKRKKPTSRSRKVRKTAKNRKESESENKVEFKHLIDKESKTDDAGSVGEDAEMNDALSFLTSDADTQRKKRRRVRRKKSSD